MVSKRQRETAWKNASPIRGRNPNLWRKDSEGHRIYKPAYGTQGSYGWEVDHKNPKAKGGTDDPRNLQALQWKANRRKRDKRR